jgi:hypothetical protein
MFGWHERREAKRAEVEAQREAHRKAVDQLRRSAADYAQWTRGERPPTDVPLTPDTYDGPSR